MQWTDNLLQFWNLAMSKSSRRQISSLRVSMTCWFSVWHAAKPAHAFAARALVCTSLLLGLFWTATFAAEDGLLQMKARHRVEKRPGSGEFQTIESQVSWDANKTAVVICDMWAKHWCRGATKRVGEMAPRMNQVVAAARQKGALIIHCPSGGMKHYEGTPMRKLAQSAKPVDTKIPLQGWCHLDDKHEAALPIDDADGGCDCWPPCSTKTPMDRHQVASVQIKAGDAITDSAEAYYLMKQKGIENVIVMGVHTNMCVLGRPFSIRQMVYQKQNVLLMRDMTDTMYNSRSKPYVSHVQGTDLVLEHIEKYWCPTITSTALTGKPALAFSEAAQPHVVFMIGEREYKTNETLPVFARQQLEPRGIRCTFVHADSKDKNEFPGLLALKSADLLFLSVRRRCPPKEQLDLVREFLASGKPLVGIRTANHAFHTRGEHPPGHDEWQSFDPDVFGGHYYSHHGNEITTTLTPADQSSGHPILKGVSLSSFLGNGSLYQVTPLKKTAQPLVIGTITDQPAEPVAWTHRYGQSRVFYTSLGHIQDFKSTDFNRLLTNAVCWALDTPVPAVDASESP